ncbi:uncharacterized protein AB675_1549 [Cyphellophora attinorum]|uniref:ubiquitinyl hydrolase 1 n=1 Tax=Cyphellophora attinorum TaxID=1664694 RepID=A0A0N1H6U8_9EURO|nr:uncharacterized protein AB675_1549 [Phialophora attinorum]KPI37175.1 hypothetical protein AB675_1549 [Phialophora attinorum]
MASSPTEQEILAVLETKTPEATRGKPLTPLHSNVSFRNDLDSMLLQLENERTSHFQLRGMANPPASHLCYRNSVLNILLYNDRFMSYVKSYLNKHSDVPGTMKPLGAIWDHINGTDANDAAYAKFIAKVWEDFWAVDSVAGPWIIPGRHNIAQKKHRVQRDASDFLDHLFAAERFQLAQKKGSDEAFMTDLNELIEINRSLFSVCRDCGTQHPAKFAHPEDVDLTWRIGLSTDQKLIDLLRRERKQPFNYQCEQCQKSTDNRPAEMEVRKAPRISYLRRLPEIIFMQLKRFDFALDSAKKGKKPSGKTGKNESKVSIDPVLDLAEHLDPVMQEWEKVDAKYDLVGVVAHYGDLNSGHYISYVNFKTEWYRLNDKVKTASNFQEAVHHDPQGFQPYLLVWQRRHEVPIAEIEKMKTNPTAAPGAASVAPARSDPKDRTSTKSPVASATKATSTGAAQASQANPATTSSEGRTTAKTPSAAAKPPLPTPAEPKSTARPSVDAPKQISPPKDSDNSKTYLHVKLGLAGKDYYIHHRLNSLGRTPVEASKHFEQAKVDLSVHLVNDLPDGVNARELDLVAAATETVRPKSIQRKRKSLQLCSCGLLHEGACGGVAHKRLRRNDWHSEESYLYPTPLSAAHREKVHAAVKAAGKEWAEKYKHLLMRRPVVQPVREPSAQAPASSSEPIYLNARAQQLLSSWDSTEDDEVYEPWDPRQPRDPRLPIKIWHRRNSALLPRPAVFTQGAGPTGQEKIITGKVMNPPLRWPKSLPYSRRPTSRPKSSLIAKTSALSKATTVCHRKVNRARAIFKKHISPLAHTSYTATKHVLTRLTKKTYRFLKNDFDRIRRGDLYYRQMAIFAGACFFSAVAVQVYRAPAARAYAMHKLRTRVRSSKWWAIKAWPSQWDAAMKDWFFTWQGIDEKDRWRYLE